MSDSLESRGWPWAALPWGVILFASLSAGCRVAGLQAIGSIDARPPRAASPVEGARIAEAGRKLPPQVRSSFRSLLGGGPADVGRAPPDGDEGTRAAPVGEEPPFLPLPELSAGACEPAECTRDEPGAETDGGYVPLDPWGEESDTRQEALPAFAAPDPADEPAGACFFTWRDDARTLFPTLRDDALSCITWPNAIIIGAAAGGAIGIREYADGKVRENIAAKPLRWGEGSKVLRQFGEFAYQVPVLAAVYGWGLWTQDEMLHEFSTAAISAYTITSLTTVAIKGVTDTARPTDRFQGGRFGFPSFHAASTFSLAAVIDKYYGWPAGLPAYALAGLVGWTRIDEREHDLSDVVFGSVLGFVIGRTIAETHLERYENISVIPYYDPEDQTTGVFVDVPF